MIASAKELVKDTLASVLPPGVPPSHKLIVEAKYNDRHHVRARLEMFDGQPAVVELTRWEYGWSIRYEFMPGGACHWTGERWERVE
jgi:hypothetical protein